MILGISGGRLNGNTDVLVKAALEECEKEGFETKFLNLSTKDINPCKACGACSTGPSCVQRDDMDEIIPMLTEAGGIIIGSPTYFSNVSSRISMLFERSVPLRRQGFQLAGKVGGAIAVGASRNGGQEYVVATIQRWFTLHGGIVVGDSAPTAHFGGIGVGHALGETKDDKDGQETSRNLGKNMAALLKKIE